jgi:hypothetical protein
MILFVAVVAFAFALGFALRGSLRGFERVSLRAWTLAAAGLGLQFAPLPTGAAGADRLVRIAVLGASYALLVAFAVLNRRMRGIPLVLIGLLLNAAVILPNGGMPVSEAAIRASGQQDMLELFVRQGATKHHLMTEDDVLRPLGDVIGVPSPIRQVVSVGDVLVYTGIVWFVVAVMRGRARPAGPGEPGRYRGKHRPGSRPRTGAAPASALPAGPG